MNKLKRIYHDGISWNFTEYFAYIKSVSSEMPASLSKYAGAVEHYELSGNYTLHDARVMSIVVEKAYSSDKTRCETNIRIIFLDQMFEGEIVLDYCGVSSFCFNEDGLSDLVSVDVLLHEFSVVRPELYSHQIVLDRGGGIYVEFTKFSADWRSLGPQSDMVGLNKKGSGSFIQ